MTRPRIELLSPAGGHEAACAALAYGADAVYLGLPRFSARAEAENAAPESLAEIVGYAHSLTPRRRVYAALNTLLREDEWPAALAALEELAAAEADAVIVQDLGLARLARRFFPRLPLHASTQMAVHNAADARQLAALGFRRVILARELSVDAAEAVARAATGVEVEMFIHGALCYSISGRCLYSAHVVGRSGNRGRCAYGCRAAFTPADGSAAALPFSMKDLALDRRLERLRAGPLASLKIEGRMKSPLYVAAVTDYYRRRLDGALREPEASVRREDLRTIFSRPWCEGPGDSGTEAVIDAETVGHRGARVGRVERIRRDPRDGFFLEFVTARALERHDGLQLDLPGRDRPFGFAVDELRCAERPNARALIRVEAGETALVQLPHDAPRLPVGAPVYCSASQAVKRAYPYDRPRPGVFRPRQPVRIEASWRPGQLTLTATATWPTLPAPVRTTLEKPGPFAPARRPEAQPAAWQAAFERLGDTDWRLEELTLDNPAGFFLPVSEINALRRTLIAQLDTAARAARAEQQTLRLEQAAAESPS